MTNRAWRASLVASLFALVVPASWLGCNAIAGIQNGELVSQEGGPNPGNDAGVDSSTPGMDATTGTDASTDSPLAQGDASSDAPVDARPDVPTTWNDMENPNYWSTFDLSGVDGGGEECEGAVFDGRYVYFVPTYSGVVERFDTQGAFTSAAAWSTYNTGQSSGFAGGVFDGRYVYFVSNVVTRYDTQGSFTAAASWSSFGVPGADAGNQALQGATFDGRYLYFAAQTIARYDTTATFNAATSWSSFDTNLILCDNEYLGAVYDGRFVYFSPHTNGCVARYDTQGSGFLDTTSWGTFDTTTVSQSAQAYYGAAFDGRYVYFPQATNFGSSPANTVARYDTQAGFGVASSWSLFDTNVLGGNTGQYSASGFDGRYVYFLQGYTGEAPGYVARYDTTGVFAADAGGDGGAWQGMSTAAFNSSAWDFHGAAYDGRYLYLAPNFNSIVARFDTKTPAWMPPLPAFHGSFY